VGFLITENGSDDLLRFVNRRRNFPLYGSSAALSYTRTGNPTLTHSYNGLDDRVSTTTGTDTRRFVYAPDGRVLGEYGTSATDVKAEFIWLNPQVGDGGTFGGDDGLGGYMPLAVVTTGGTLSWVHGDHLGTPILLTNATGAAIAQPSGYSTPAFPGQSKTLADLYYNRYRDYDPTTGRYIQADPIGLEGGASPYSYAMNNPLRYTDPDGLNPVTAGRFAVGVGEVAGQGLIWWCRSNLALCMRTIGPPAIRVAQACQAIADVLNSDNDGPQCHKARPWELREAGITDLHAFKEDILGTRKKLSAYDICKCNDGSFRLAPVGTCSTSKIFVD
jgi:RHS repeat-associated protein